MKPLDVTYLSAKNNSYRTKLLTVANGTQVVVLDMTEEEVADAKNVLYLHVHHDTSRCYVGQALKKCKYRWGPNGTGYKPYHQPKFRAAIDRHGWAAFTSYILAFCDDPGALDAAETKCIAALGGHRSRFLFNLAPGGRATVDRSEALEGYNLKTKEWRQFRNSTEAAEFIGIQKAGNIRRVVNGENKSAGGWWFRRVGSKTIPPERWGLGSAKQQTRPVTGIRINDNAEFQFDSIAAASLHLGAHTSNVTHAVKGTNGGTCNGYWLRYTDSAINKPALVGRAGSVYKNGKPVVATNIQSGEQRFYLSGRAAAAALGVTDKNMPAALKGRIKSMGGWRYRYATVDEAAAGRFLPDAT